MSIQKFNELHLRAVHSVMRRGLTVMTGEGHSIMRRWWNWSYKSLTV